MFSSDVAKRENEKRKQLTEDENKNHKEEISTGNTSNWWNQGQIKEHFLLPGLGCFFISGQQNFIISTSKRILYAFHSSLVWMNCLLWLSYPCLTFVYWTYRMGWITFFFFIFIKLWIKIALSNLKKLLWSILISFAFRSKILVAQYNPGCRG